MKNKTEKELRLEIAELQAELARAEKRVKTILTKRQKMESELREARDELEIRVQERTAELAKANELLERIFASTHFLIAFMDKDFNFIRVNRAYAGADGREPEFFAGENHFALYPNEENEAIFRKVVDTGEPHFELEKPFIYAEHPERGVTYWDWSLDPVKGSDGKVSGVILSLVNVTERKLAQEARARLTRILEATSDFVAFANMEGQVLYYNQAARRMLGIAQDEDISQIMIPDTHPDWAKSIVLGEGIPAAIREGIWSGETALLSRDGREVSVSQVILSHKAADGSIEFLSTIARDITERKEIENRIRATNALLNLFPKKASRKEYLDAVVDLTRTWSQSRCVGIRVLDERGYIPYESYVGFSQEFWEAENWLSVGKDQCVCIRVLTGKADPPDISAMTPAGSFRCDDTFKLLEDLSEEEKIKYRGVCVKNGYRSVAVIPIRYDEKVRGVIHLADERKGYFPLEVVESIESMAPLLGEAINKFNLEDELRRSENQLRLLSSQLMMAQENERKWIAQELHDSIGQTLTAVKFSLERKLSQMGQRKAPPGISLEDIVSMLQNGIEETRRIMTHLRPSILDDLGIIATLNWLCREFQKVYPHMRLEKKVDIQEDEVPDALKIVIFRVVQEAMNNCAKHSQGDLLSIVLKKNSNGIELVIQDNGLGFDPQNAPKGLGMASMKERTEHSGGIFSALSTRGAGTCVRATWGV